MSPEQASAEEVDHRADVFALGVVLWEALTGRRLFRRETELATMRAIVDDPIPHPSEIAPSIPPELDAIVMRALRKRQGRRFATAHEMAVALERSRSRSRVQPDADRDLHEVAVRDRVPAVAKTATAALDLEVEKPAAGKAGHLGPERGAADRRPDDGVRPAFRGRTAAASCAARTSGAAAAAARASCAAAFPRASRKSRRCSRKRRRPAPAW